MSSQESSKAKEWRAFLITTVLMFPILAAAIVASYGFVIWILQIIYGPPGHGM